MDGTYLWVLGVVLFWGGALSAFVLHESLSRDIGKLRGEVKRLRAEVRRSRVSA